MEKTNKTRASKLWLCQSKARGQIGPSTGLRAAICKTFLSSHVPAARALRCDSLLGGCSRGAGVLCRAASPVSSCQPRVLLPPTSPNFLPISFFAPRDPPPAHEAGSPRGCDAVVPLIILISTSALPCCQQQLKEKLQRTKLIICSSAAHGALARLTPKATRAARCRKHLLPSDCTVTSLPAPFYICALPD